MKQKKTCSYMQREESDDSARNTGCFSKSGKYKIARQIVGDILKISLVRHTINPQKFPPIQLQRINEYSLYVLTRILTEEVPLYERYYVPILCVCM